MFDKFGEMNSYTEINELAANLLQEGDLDSLKELAKENGIPDDYVEMYLEEAIPSLQSLSFLADLVCNHLILHAESLDVLYPVQHQFLRL